MESMVVSHADSVVLLDISFHAHFELLSRTDSNMATKAQREIVCLKITSTDSMPHWPQ